MLTGDQFVTTDIERRKQRVDAQVAFECATENLASLLFTAKAIGSRAQKIATTTAALELCPEEPLQSESRLLQLAPGDYQDITFATLRELGNRIVLARKEVAEAQALARALGCKV